MEMPQLKKKTVTNYHSSLSNDPTESSSRLLHGGTPWILLEIIFLPKF